MNKRMAILAGLVLLTGCGGKGDDSSGNDSTAVPATVPEATDENLIQDPQNRAVPLNPPAARPSAAATPRS
jgi:hypothetical protein